MYTEASGEIHRGRIYPDVSASPRLLRVPLVVASDGQVDLFEDLTWALRVLITIHDTQ
jgi:hypothetical protein